MFQNLKTEWKLFGIVAAVVLTIIVGLFVLWWSSNQAHIDEWPVTFPEGEVVLQGVVLENIPACVVDGPCYFRLLKDGQEYQVVYYPTEGESQDCVNEQAASIGEDLQQGDEVEVFGKAEAGIISTCSSKNYYIKKLSEGKEIIDDEFASWQTYRNDEFGFEVKYPEDWRAWEQKFPDHPDRIVVDFGEEEEVLDTLTGEMVAVKGAIGVGISVVREIQVTEQDLRDSFEPLKRGEKIERIFFGAANNYEGWLVEKHGGVGVTAIIPRVYANYGGDGYTFLGFVPTSFIEGFSDTEGDPQEIFNLILSTFRFVE